MAKSLREWVATDVAAVKEQPLQWLSEMHFFRDPSRPMYSDIGYFFSPADGILLYQQRVRPDESILDIKGRPYSLREALRDETFHKDCLVIGIFMTMYDCHVNRVPYPGFLSHRQLDPIGTLNLPMLEVERDLVEELKIDHRHVAGYLHNNQRMVNRIYAPELRDSYYILQIADYDVDCITPFDLGQNVPVAQNGRFSQIRFGSQVDLIVPLSRRYRLETLQQTGSHVEAGLDPLIRVSRTS